VRAAARKALKITTKILQLLESNVALLVTNIIPGEKDDALRLALIALLKTFNPILEVATTGATRKAIAARIAAELVAAQDQHRERMGTYSIIVEQVYQQEFKPA
jgi:hypothetical protein